MVKLSKKHKDQLVGGLIASFILLITLTIRHFLLKDNSKKDTTTNLSNTVTQNPTVTSINHDSSTQTIYQVPQTNSNNGDVSNEFVSGDKKTYNTYVKPSKKTDTTIVNNGFLNQGGIGNTYNQTINPEIPQRKISLDEEWYLNATLPKKSVNYTVYIYNNDPESRRYAQDIISHLKKLNKLWSIAPIGILFGDPKKGQPVGIFPSEDSSKIDIVVFPLN
jgi:hypothetical protein